MHIKVRVITEAKKDEIKELAPDTLVVSVRAKAERNEANHEIIRILADYFAVLPKQIKLVVGHHSPAKIFEILS